MKKVDDKIVLEFLENSATFLKNKFLHLGEQIDFSLSVLNQQTPPDTNTYTKIGDSYFKKFDKKSWRDKVDLIASHGGSSIDFDAALVPKNEGEDYERILIGKIYCKCGVGMLGELDFIREYSGDVIMKEFIIAAYRLENKSVRHSLTEITANWEDGIKLVAMSINDFNKNPDLFIDERILRHS